MMIGERQPDGTYVFLLEDLWERAKEWARGKGMRIEAGNVQGAPPL